MEQVFSDLTAAYGELPENEAEEGRLTKYAAAHFLAKAYLWRASELNDNWNSSTKSSDLTNVVKYATEVISKHPLSSPTSKIYGIIQKSMVLMSN